MTKPIFPINLSAYESPAGWVESPRGFEKLFEQVRKRRVSYFGYEVAVQTSDTVVFTVFDMRDNVTGGIGDTLYETAAVSVKEFPDALIAIEKAITSALTMRAKIRRRAELAAQEAAIVQAYADEERAALGLVREVAL